MSKILFIFEGEKQEKQYFNLLNKFLKKEQKPREMVSVNANIYMLYEQLSKDRGLDIIELIKEKAKNGSKNDIKNYEVLNNNVFSEKYLVFDFDPQDEKFSLEKVNEMIKLFDNETEQGKLYINYPMIESIRHFKTIPDFNYVNYRIKKDDIKNYKDLVNSFMMQISKITYMEHNIIVKQNIEKIYYLNDLINKNDYMDYRKYLTQENILKLQEKSLKYDEIHIINTFCFWMLDYYGEKIFNKYIKNK